MHILVVPSWYSTSENPMLGSFFKEQSIALQNHGNKVTLAYVELQSIKSRKNTFGYHKKNDENLSTYRFNTTNLTPKISFGIEYTIYSKLDFLMRKIINERGKPDIIHLHSFIMMGTAVRKISKKYNIPYVYTEHHTGFSRGLFSSKQLLNLKSILKDSSWNIAVGSGLKSELEKYTERSVTVIPNLVDVKKFKYNEVANQDNKVFCFFSLGFLTEKKGFDILIKAFQVFKSRNFKLLIGGDGEEKNRLMLLVTELGLQSQVEFLGMLSREEVVKYMNLCNVFVLPSRHETFGVVFIEALAVGKPIISSDCEGPREIVNESNGIVVQRDNITELSIAMENISDNYDFYERDAIRKDCIEKYSQEAVVKKLNNIYEKVNNNRK